MGFTAEQFIEAVMTNFIVRAAEILLPSIWIWFKSPKAKKDWPRPVFLGLILVVLASSLFLEERVTSAVKQWTYSEKRAIRDWLDARQYSSKVTTNDDEIYRFTGTGDTRFDIFRKKASPGVVSVVYGIKINADVKEKLKKLTQAERKRLWVELFFELSRHDIYLPLGGLKEGEILETILAQSSFHLPPDTADAELDKQLNGISSMKYLIDLVFESWKANGKL